MYDQTVTLSWATTASLHNFIMGCGAKFIATVGALAATPGVEAQLLSHTRASLRVGLTAAQLRQLAQVLREHGDNDAATRADEALQKALENK